MPGAMDGMKLAAAVRKRWPPIEIIIVTAGTMPTHQDLPERAIVMSKPLNYERVVKAMNRLTPRLNDRQ
jgi:DNA-binding LytR/AlgR family response regulator